MALNVAFKDLGYITDDGVNVSPSVDLTDIKAWQSAVPVKTTLDSVTLELKFSMLEVKLDTWQLYFFNTTATNNFGQGKFQISSSPGSQEKALIIDWTDDNNDKTRLVLPKAILADREALQLVRNQAQMTGITFRALDSSGTLAYLYSSNVDLVPTT